MTTFDIESIEAMAGSESKTLHVAMIGTRGVPAAYGGFETAVEEVGRRLVERGHQVTVYCRNADTAITTHLGMRLVNLPAVSKRSRRDAQPHRRSRCCTR